jgi:hypothetical protein
MCDLTIQGPWGRNLCVVCAILDLKKDGSPQGSVENAQKMPRGYFFCKIVKITSYKTTVCVF